MDSFQSRLHQWDVQWQVRQQADEIERARIAFLNKLPAPPPRELIEPTRCKVLKASFCIAGKPVEVDDVITIDRYTALSLQATGKLQIL